MKRKRLTIAAIEGAELCGLEGFADAEIISFGMNWPTYRAPGAYPSEEAAARLHDELAFQLNIKNKIKK